MENKQKLWGMISKLTWNPVSKEVVLQEVIMNIRKYQNIDKNSLIKRNPNFPLMDGPKTL